MKTSLFRWTVSWKKRFRTHRFQILCLLIILCFNLFAFLRILPVNSSLEMNNTFENGILNRRATLVFQLAGENASKPFLEESDHALNFERDPALYKFVTEVFIRMGAERPFPIQLFTLAFINIGIVAMLAWVSILFKSKHIAFLSLVFLVSTSYLPFIVGSIHSNPYTFAFINVAIYFFIRYLITGQSRYLGGACISYFIITQNYYMFYMNTAIIFIGLSYYYKQKIATKAIGLLLLIPVISFGLVFLQMLMVNGGLTNAWGRLSEIVAARTVDLRTEGGEWYPDQRFVKTEDFFNFFSIINTRVKDMFYSGIPQYLALLSLGFLVKSFKNVLKENLLRMGTMLCLFFVAAIAWNIVFFQHTVIHPFSAEYGFFFWMLAFSIGLYSVASLFKKQLRSKGWLVPYLFSFFILSPMLYPMMESFLGKNMFHLVTYIKNVILLVSS
jgi:hypothetical protein